jgi:hypothetical protein
MHLEFDSYPERLFLGKFSVPECDERSRDCTCLQASISQRDLLFKVEQIITFLIPCL